MIDFLRACAAALGAFAAVVVMAEFVVPGFASPLLNIPALVAAASLVIAAAVGRNGASTRGFWLPFGLVQGAAAAGIFFFALSIETWDAFAGLVAVAFGLGFAALDLWWILRWRRLRAAEAAATLDAYDRLPLL